MTTESPGLLVAAATPAPRAVPMTGGEVVVYSTPSPDKLAPPAPPAADEPAAEAQTAGAANEDGAAVLEYPGGGLLAVADGMGGQNAGQRASRATLESLAARLREGARRGEPLRHVVMDAAEAANQAVLAFGVGAGSTLAAFLLREGRARTLHVGDSLALHIGQRGRVKARTIAHSPTGYAVEAGLLEEGDDALQHAERHLISNYVGSPEMRIEVGPAVPIAPRDTLLLASDGLTDNLTLDEIAAIIRKGPLLRAAERLVALASRRMRSPGPGEPSKPDDLTFVLYRRAATAAAGSR